MEQQFTKEEAFNLLGETIQFKEDLYSEYPEIDMKFISIASGTVADVFSIEVHDGDFYLGLYVDVNFELMDKEKFYQYCQLVNPESISNACAV